MAYTLLSAQKTNGDGAVIRPLHLNEYRHTPLTVYLSGTFGAATVTLYVSPDGTTWFPLPNGAFTAATVINIDVTCVAVKATISSADGTTNLTALAL